MTKTQVYSPTQKLLAWSVHLFTSSGLLAAFMAILAINEKDWKAAMLWLILCLIIDGIDGTFARLFKVKEVLPHIDGKAIDYVIDFATYAIIPAYFFYEAELVSASLALPCVFTILMVSAIYYGITGMVSDDMYFIGFPVLWNMVVFYLVFITNFSPFGNAITILFFAVLHFIPIKFAYPSQGTRFKQITIFVTILFFIGVIGATLFYPEKNPVFTGLSILTALYYGGMGVYTTWFER